MWWVKEQTQGCFHTAAGQVAKHPDLQCCWVHLGAQLPHTHPPPPPAGPIPALHQRILLVGRVLSEQAQLHRARLDEVVQLPLRRLQLPQLLLQQPVPAGGPHGGLVAPEEHRSHQKPNPTAPSAPHHDSPHLGQAKSHPIPRESAQGA